MTAVPSPDRVAPSAGAPDPSASASSVAKATTGTAAVDAPSHASASGDWLSSGWIGLIALLPRLYVAIAWPREPVWDGHYYDFGARRIAAGFGYSDGTTVWHPWCHWPVGYSAFLAGVYKIFGAGPHTGTIASAVVGAVLAVAVHRFSRAWLSPWRARIAGLLTALDPGLVAFGALIMSEPLAALVLVLSGWLAVRLVERAPARGAALTGVVLGLGTLVRPTFIAHAPALAWVFWRSRSERRGGPLIDRRALGVGALATAVAIATVLPWTIRNCRVMDRCAFVSTNGGWNLAIGAFSRATGRFETLRSTDGCAVVTGQVQQDACWRDLALREIRARPLRWLALIPKKLAYTFDQESFPVEYLHEADPDRWPPARREGGRQILTFAHRMLLVIAAFSVIGLQAESIAGRTVQAVGALGVAALAALVYSAGDPPFYLLFLATLVLGFLPLPGRPPQGPVHRWLFFSFAATVGTHAILFGEDRYHVVITPLVCMLAAAALRRSAPEEPTTHTPEEPSAGIKTGVRVERPHAAR